MAGKSFTLLLPPWLALDQQPPLLAPGLVRSLEEVSGTMNSAPFPGIRQ